MASTLRIDCLGSGHAFSHGRDWSGFLLNGRVLLDCPPQALAALYRLGGAATIASIDLILLSHLHADHVLGMDLLLLELAQGLAADIRGGRPLAVAGPLGTYDRLRAIVGSSDRLPPRDDPRIAWLEADTPGTFAWAGIEVDRVVMEHDPRLVTLGYRVHLPDDGLGRAGVVAYTGDTRMCPAIDELTRGTDVLIVECGGPPREGAPATHLDWPEVLGLAERLNASAYVLVTHYSDYWNSFERDENPRTIPPLPPSVCAAHDRCTYHAVTPDQGDVDDAAKPDIDLIAEEVRAFWADGIPVHCADRGSARLALALAQRSPTYARESALAARENDELGGSWLTHRVASQLALLAMDEAQANAEAIAELDALLDVLANRLEAGDWHEEVEITIGFLEDLARAEPTATGGLITSGDLTWEAGPEQREDVQDFIRRRLPARLLPEFRRAWEWTRREPYPANQ